MALFSQLCAYSMSCDTCELVRDTYPKTIPDMFQKDSRKIFLEFSRGQASDEQTDWRTDGRRQRQYPFGVRVESKNCVVQSVLSDVFLWCCSLRVMEICKKENSSVLVWHRRYRCVFQINWTLEFGLWMYWGVIVISGYSCIYSSWWYWLYGWGQCNPHQIMMLMMSMRSMEPLSNNFHLPYVDSERSISTLQSMYR